MSPELLLAGDIHIWTITARGNHPGSEQLLAAAERQRANRFHCAKRAATWRYFRCAMRVILSRYSALPPNELRFIAGQYGKPALAQQPGLWFNLSHSRDLALLAVTRAAPVGIDVEDRQREVEVPQLAQRIFSATEMAGFMACHEGGRRTLFFDLWTRKEAVLKASGKGLSMPLDAFDVSTEPDAGWHEVSVRAATPGDEQYLLCALHIAGEYAGAVALQRAASVAEAPPGLRYQDY